MLKFSVCILLVSATFAFGLDFHPEDPCSSEGGICVLEKDCRESKLAKGLCPEQQSQGAECCHRIPANYKDCASYGGSCEPSCPPVILRKDLKCTGGQSCCIYL